jgi:hypothetical protein
VVHGAHLFVWSTDIQARLEAAAVVVAAVARSSTIFLKTFLTTP